MRMKSFILRMNFTDSFFKIKTVKKLCTCKKKYFKIFKKKNGRKKV